MLKLVAFICQDILDFLRDLLRWHELDPITCPEYGEWHVADRASGCGKPRVPQIALLYRLRVRIEYREQPFAHLLTFFFTFYPISHIITKFRLGVHISKETILTVCLSTINPCLSLIILNKKSCIIIVHCKKFLL